MSADQPNKSHGLRGVARLIAAYRHSKAGLRDIWKNEEAFRLEVVVFLVACPVAFLIGSGPGQIGLLIGSLFAVIIVEILNTALEAVVDRIGPEHHELSRIAKDLGSAAVLLTALFPATVWGLVLLDVFGLIDL